jgi:hypothetical protein
VAILDAVASFLSSRSSTTRLHHHHHHHSDNNSNHLDDTDDVSAKVESAAKGCILANTTAFALVLGAFWLANFQPTLLDRLVSVVTF